MSKTLFAVTCGTLLLSGCANDNYRLYTEAQKSVINAKAMSEAARYQALTEIAKSGDNSTKAAAVMGLSTPSPAHTVSLPERKWYQFD